MTSGGPSGPTTTVSSGCDEPLTRTSPSARRARTSTVTSSGAFDVHLADAEVRLHLGRLGRRLRDVDVHGAERHDLVVRAGVRVAVHADPVVAGQLTPAGTHPGGDAADEAGGGERGGRQDQPSSPPTERADEQAEPTDARGRSEPLLGVQAAAVQLVDDRPDGRDDDGDAERRPAEDRGRPGRRWGHGLGRRGWLDRGPGRRRRPRERCRSGGARLPEGHGQPHEQADDADGPGDEVERVGPDEQRHADEDDGAAGVACRRALGPGAHDERQPEPQVHDEPEAADEREQHERQPHPERVQPEPSGQQTGHPAEDPVRRRSRRGRAPRRRREVRRGGGGGDVHEADGTDHLAAVHRGSP